LLADLKAAVSLDRAHLPSEISLIGASERAFPGVPQVVCFDTVFHNDLPRVARVLPIPRSYDDAGVQRLGFHGLSYEYLMMELERTAGAQAASGRVVLAHLGSGASMSAVRGGRPIDTTMGFTPTGGLVMATRPGDVDPGVIAHIARAESLHADGLDDLINRRCGLAAVSGGVADMRTLLRTRASDVRASEAVDLFCRQARKWIGALAAALGGLETVVFSGGIGAGSAEIRRAICDGLEFLGVGLDDERNAAGAGVISADSSRTSVRVIRTDEERMIARHVVRLLERV
jgi:acetate kinase